MPRVKSYTPSPKRIRTGPEAPITKPRHKELIQFIGVTQLGIEAFFLLPIFEVGVKQTVGLQRTITTSMRE